MATSRLTGLYVSVLEAEPLDERVSQAGLEVAAQATALPIVARAQVVGGAILLTAITERDASQVGLEVAGDATALPPASARGQLVGGAVMLSEPADERVSQAGLEVASRFFQEARVWRAGLEVAAAVPNTRDVARAGLEVSGDSTYIKPLNNRRVIWWSAS